MDYNGPKPGKSRIAKEVAAQQPPPQVPDWLDPIAREVWDHTLSCPHSITEADRDLLAAYAVTVSKFQAVERAARDIDAPKQITDLFLKLGGQIDRYAKSLCLSPAARAAKRAPVPDQGQDALGIFLESNDSEIPEAPYA